MPSNALSNLIAGLKEVEVLRSANPSRVGRKPRKPELSQVVGRACVVLLSSHLERYIRALHEEACEWTNSKSVKGVLLPKMLKLRHSGHVLEEIFSTQWDNRSDQLEDFGVSNAWLWNALLDGSLT